MISKDDPDESIISILDRKRSFRQRIHVCRWALNNSSPFFCSRALASWGERPNPVKSTNDFLHRSKAVDELDDVSSPIHKAIYGVCRKFVTQSPCRRNSSLARCKGTQQTICGRLLNE